MERLSALPFEKVINYPTAEDKRRDPIMTWEMLKNDVAYAARNEGLEEGRAEGEKIGASKEKVETALRMQTPEKR